MSLEHLNNCESPINPRNKIASIVRCACTPEGMSNDAEIAKPLSSLPEFKGRKMGRQPLPTGEILSRMTGPDGTTVTMHRTSQKGAYELAYREPNGLSLNAITGFSYYGNSIESGDHEAIIGWILKSGFTITSKELFDDPNILPH